MIPASAVVLLPVACAGAVVLLPRTLAARHVALLDAGARIVVLLACLVLFLIDDEPAWPDALSLLTASLVAAQSALVGLFHLRGGARSRLVWARDQGVLAGLLLVALVSEPLLVWLALLLTAVVSRLAERPRIQDARRQLSVRYDPEGAQRGAYGGAHGDAKAGIGTGAPPRGVPALAARVGASSGHPGPIPAPIQYGPDGLIAAAGCLILFGLIALPAAPTLLALGCLLLGQAMLVVMVPALLPLVLVLVARFRAIASLTHDAALTDAMLIALGLGSALICAAMLLMRPRGLVRSLGLVRIGGHDRLTLLHIGQTGIGVFAFGLGTAEALFAGLVTLLLLAVTWTASQITTTGRLEHLVAVAGMAGVPPFGVWPGLVLIVLATAHRSVWLLLALGLVLGLIAWATVAHRPVRQWKRAPAPALAWVPLAATVLIGLAMPDVVTAWLRIMTLAPG